MHHSQAAAQVSGQLCARLQQGEVQTGRFGVAVERIERRHDHWATPSAGLLDQQDRARCVSQQFPVGVGQQPAGEMSRGMAFSDDHVGLDAQSAPDDRLGDGIIPFGGRGDFDAVLADAAGHQFKTLDDGGVTLLLILAQALAASLECVDHHRLRQ